MSPKKKAINKPTKVKSRRGAKGKYNEAVIDRICKAISQTGSESNGYKAGLISNDTFYKWKREKTDFADKVAQAHKDFRDMLWRDNPKIIEDAIVELHKHITDNEDTWQKQTTLTDGKIIRTISKVKRRGAKWAIDRVLGYEPITRGLSGKSIPTSSINTEHLVEAMDCITQLSRNTSKVLRTSAK